MRARNIKPGFWKNELVAQMPPIVRLLYIGLWCLADREGRLEDRPSRIHIELFPYQRNMDIHGYLTVIERLGFIQRYKVGECSYIQVNNFIKHQNPHHTERRSEIPENQSLATLTVNPPLSNGEYLADSLNPDSLNPDSLIQDKGVRQIKKFEKPNPVEVTTYAKEIGFELDGESFCDYYETKGWVYGKSPMKSWKAAVRTWKRNQGGNYVTRTTPIKNVGYASAIHGKYPD